MTSKPRRWEKTPNANAPAPGPAPASSSSPANVPAAAASSPNSPASQISSFLHKLSPSEQAAHRVAFLHLLQSMTGTNVTVNVEDGSRVAGVFHTATFFPGKDYDVVIKASRTTNASDGTANKAIESDGNTSVLKYSNISTILSGKLDLVAKSVSSEFQTDSAIKKHGDMSHLDGRRLQSLDNSWFAPAGDMSLDSKGSKTWDQFETNKRLFNVKDTYDENLYTKKLDLSSVNAEQIARAERLAREIESQSSSNVHLQEERGQVAETDMDEEDKYSGVIRTNNDSVSPSKATKPTETKNAWTRGLKFPAAQPASGPASAGPSPKSTAGTTAPAINNNGGIKRAQGSVPSTQGGSAPPTSGGTTPTNSKPRAITPSTGASTPTKEVVATDAKVSGTEMPKKVSPAKESTKDTQETEKQSVGKGIPSTPSASTREEPPAKRDQAPATPVVVEEKKPEVVPEVKPKDEETKVKNATPSATESQPKSSKLNAGAAEFTPSWMKSPSTPAAVAPIPAQTATTTPQMGQSPMMAMGFMPNSPMVPPGTYEGQPYFGMVGPGSVPNPEMAFAGGIPMVQTYGIPGMPPDPSMAPGQFDGAQYFPPQQQYYPNFVPQQHMGAQGLAMPPEFAMYPPAPYVVTESGYPAGANMAGYGQAPGGNPYMFPPMQSPPMQYASPQGQPYVSYGGGQKPYYTDGRGNVRQNKGGRGSAGGTPTGKAFSNSKVGNDSFPNPSESLDNEEK